MLNIIARIFGLLLLVELLTGYYFNMSATYFSSGHFLSATMRLIDIAKSKIEILKIDSTVKTSSTLKECDTQNLAMDVLIPSYFNSHKTESKKHLKFQMQFAGPYTQDTLLKFPEVNENYVILISGGSEIMGFSHGNMKVHKILQALLREKFNTKNIIVVNAGNYGHFLTDDINFFNLVGVHLNPKLLILHTGANDFGFGVSAFKDAKYKNYEFHKKLGFFNKYSNISSSNKAFKNINNEKKDCWIVNPETTSSLAEGELEFDNSKSNQFVSYKPTNGPMDMILKRYSQRLNHFTTQLDKKNINYIVGIETFDKDSEPDKQQYDAEHLHPLKHLYSKDPRFYNFDAHKSKLSWHDETHTDPKGALEIAKTYFDLVIRNNTDKIVNFLQVLNKNKNSDN